MSKQNKSFVTIHAIIGAVFIALFAFIPFEKPGASWLMFIFSVIAIAGNCWVSIYTFGRSDSLMSKFYGYPVFKIGLYYMLIQLGLSVLLFIIGAFVDVPYWVGLLLSLVLAGIAAIGMIAADNAHDVIQQMDTQSIEITRNVTRFNVDLGDALDLCQNPQLRQPLQELATKCKYTDPVSIPQTQELEERIKEAIGQLLVLLEQNQAQQALEQINLITRLLSSRNRIKSANS